MPAEKTEKTCFVLMPFSVKEADQSRYPDPLHWNEVYEGLIMPAVQQVGLACERDDQDIGSRFIGENILRKIENASIILCDLSSHNPNVFLELGWALRADKPFVLIKDDLTVYAFDLNQQYTFEYSHALQPTRLREEVRAMADVLQRTLNDSEERYSIVRRMSISLSAIEAIKRGDPQTKLLLDIQQKLTSMQPAPGKGQSQLVEFPWPQLLRQANTTLFAVKEALSKLESHSTQSQIVSLVDQTTTRLGARHSRDIQVTVIDEERILLFHDWENLIGEYAPHTAGDVYGEVFSHPHGAVAWIDRTTNVRADLLPRPLRLNIALFSTLDNSGWKIVVETHHEVEPPSRIPEGF